MKLFTGKVLSGLSFAAISSLVSTGGLQAHDHYRSIASEVLANHVMKIEDKSVQAQVKATNDFIATLDDSLKKKLLFPLDSTERGIWTNVGTPKDAKGLRMHDLNAEQVKGCMRMLATMMGNKGYAAAVEVPLADDELIPAGEKKVSDNGYGVANFTLLVFGEPSVDKPWGIQYDGHHLIFNITVHGDKMSMSPSFIGTRPSTFMLNGKEVKPINGLAEKGHELVGLLDDEQKKQAILPGKPFNLRTGAGKDGVVPAARGVKVSSFNEKQKGALLALISEYTATMPHAVAQRRNEELKKEFDQMHFVWGGSVESGKPMSYAIQSPTLIIEYACQGRGNKSLDHIHAMYRDPTNEYGAQFVK